MIDVFVARRPVVVAPEPEWSPYRTFLTMRLLALALAFGGCARWTKYDTALELSFAATQVIDYRQTSEAVTMCAEANPIIGDCGQVSTPAAYFLTTTLLHVFVAAALPRGWREAFQGATVTSQTWNVYGNVAALDSNRRLLAAEAHR